MADVDAFTSPLSSFDSYRRRLAQAAIAYELDQRSKTRTTGTADATRVDVVALTAGLSALTASPDPQVVFGGLVEVLVPAVCDTATVTIYVKNGGASWRRQPLLTVDVQSGPVDVGDRGWELTVHVAGHRDSSGGEPHYVAAVTCCGRGAHPSSADVAIIKLAGRRAASIVQQTRQARLVQSQQEQITNLRTALDRNRVIGTAAGALMATQQLSYQQAFDLLARTSETTDMDMAAVAETVVRTGRVPPSAG